MALVLVGKLLSIIHKPSGHNAKTGEMIPENWQLNILEESPTEVKISKITIKEGALLKPFADKVGTELKIPVRLFSPKDSANIYYSLS